MCFAAPMTASTAMVPVLIDPPDWDTPPVLPFAHASCPLVPVKSAAKAVRNGPMSRHYTARSGPSIPMPPIAWSN